MLLSIYIENIALIKKLSLDLSEGFCAFTGETGAGKSIIIDSLGLLCGARSDKDIIRTGEDEAFVEGIFSAEGAGIGELLERLELEAEEDGTLTVSRKISRDGRSGAKINGRTVPLSRLRSVMEGLLSIHGQQDTQAFADASRQRDMLDLFADNGDIFGEYTARYSEYTEKQRDLDELKKLSADRDFRIEMLTYRVGELKKAKVRAGELSELEAERKRLANSEKIVASSSAAYDLLYDCDGSAVEKVDTALSAIEALASAIPEASELSERLDAAKCELKDIADTVKSFLDDDYDDVNARLDGCESRIQQIKWLESKYKANADEFPELLSKWESELSSVENLESEEKKREADLKRAKDALKCAAKALTESRRSAAERLCARVTDELCAVDMPGVHFEVAFTETEFSASGGDGVEFLISANKGELPKPMSKIASGGELSRIMLCLKCVFADTEAIGTLIFDEIDSGVSGSTSEKIAKRLKKAADGGRTQVICVTHSAILASKADAHYKIKKSETDGRVITTVEKLDREGRRDELARILGGVNITDTVLKAADEMLDD